MTADARRLDEMLVERGFFPSRSRAADAVRRGCVSVDGVPATRTGRKVPESAKIAVDDPARSYVSRAALKLVAGLEGFGFLPAGKVCLDIGASTGGFTQVLLEQGAARVIALDVGHGQLDPDLRGDPRVRAIERLNARNLDAGHLAGEEPGLIVSDVSFISLRLALPPALALAPAGAEAVLLVKPQFEAGRDAVGGGGIVAPAEAEKVGQILAEWLNGEPGWRTLGLLPSPITGGDGNREFLLGGRKDRSCP